MQKRKRVILHIFIMILLVTFLSPTIPVTKIKANSMSYGRYIVNLDKIEQGISQYKDENNISTSTDTLLLYYLNNEDNDLVSYLDDFDPYLYQMQLITKLRVPNGNSINPKEVLNMVANGDAKTAWISEVANLSTSVTNGLKTAMDAYLIRKTYGTHKLSASFTSFYHRYQNEDIAKTFVSSVFGSCSMKWSNFRKTVYRKMNTYQSIASQTTDIFAEYLYQHYPSYSIEDITLSGETKGLKYLDVGDTKQISIATYPIEAKYKTITYHSSDSSIISVSKTGEMYGQKEGKATITVQVGASKAISFPIQVVKGITSVSLKQMESEYEVGSSFSMKFKILPLDATIQKLNWSSSNPYIADVDEEGKVQTLQAGYTTITGTSYNGISIQKHMKIFQKIEQIEAKENQTLVMGKPDKIKYQIYPLGITDQHVTFTSNQANIVEIDETGMMTPRKNGVATIIIASERHPEITTTVNVTVITKMKDLIPSKNQSYYMGRKEKFRYKTNPITTSNKKLKYKMEENEYAEVTEDGTIIPKKIGMCDLEVSSTDGTKIKKIVTISIEDMVSKIAVAKKIYMKKGQAFQLHYTIYPTTATKKNISIISDNKNKILVDKTGKLKAVGYGTCKLTLKAKDPSGVTTYCTVVVKRPIWHYILGLVALIAIGYFGYKGWKKYKQK